MKACFVRTAVYQETSRIEMMSNSEKIRPVSLVVVEL